MVCCSLYQEFMKISPEFASGAETNKKNNDLSEKSMSSNNMRH